jgi:hypothetical protein
MRRFLPILLVSAVVAPSGAPAAAEQTDTLHLRFESQGTDVRAEFELRVAAGTTDTLVTGFVDESDTAPWLDAEHCCSPSQARLSLAAPEGVDVEASLIAQAGGEQRWGFRWTVSGAPAGTSFALLLATPERELTVEQLSVEGASSWESQRLAGAGVIRIDSPPPDQQFTALAGPAAAGLGYTSIDVDTPIAVSAAMGDCLWMCGYGSYRPDGGEAYTTVTADPDGSWSATTSGYSKTVGPAGTWSFDWIGEFLHPQARRPRRPEDPLPPEPIAFAYVPVTGLRFKGQTW